MRTYALSGSHSTIIMPLLFNVSHGMYVNIAESHMHVLIKTMESVFSFTAGKAEENKKRERFWSLMRP
jgi:hypothetical protein